MTVMRCFEALSQHLKKLERLRKHVPVQHEEVAGFAILFAKWYADERVRNTDDVCPEEPLESLWC